MRAKVPSYPSPMMVAHKLDERIIPNRISRRSVLRHHGVDFLPPRADAALEVLCLLEPHAVQESGRLSRPHTRVALNYNEVGGAEFVHPLGELGQWNQPGSFDVVDLVLPRFPDVDDHDLL